MKGLQEEILRNRTTHRTPKEMPVETVKICQRNTFGIVNPDV